MTAPGQFLLSLDSRTRSGAAQPSRNRDALPDTRLEGLQGYESARDDAIVHRGRSGAED